jgi:hypothetical protein
LFTERMMRRYAAFLLALSLACPAQAQTTQPPAATAKPAVKKNAQPKATSASRSAPQPGGPCIGVIPLLGDRFVVRKIGVTVFGNEEKEIPVDGWGLDDLVVERVRAAVGPGMIVRRIPADKAAFQSYDPGLGLFRNNEKPAAVIQQVVGAAGCERYVVVIKAGRQYVGNQGIYGVGVVKGSPLYSRADVYAIVRIYVHDGRSFAIVKSAEGSTSGSNFMSGPPTLQIDGSRWPEPPETANNPAMRASARELLGNVLDKSLPALLGP